MTDRLLSTLRRWAARRHDPDADLLARFAATGDAAAFEALVGRHGPLVWAVCRRMRPADPDDAFQATFLALTRAAGRVRVDRTLGGWLHGVAVRVCLKARRQAARRAARERAAARPEAAAADPAWDAAQAAVHEEVERLPGPLRAAFVLCDLEGVPAAEAAARLGWKAGTLTGRLCRARRRLRDRLVGRGLAPAAAVAAVSVEAAAAGWPARLAAAVLAPGPAGRPGVSDRVLELARGAEGTMATTWKVVAAGLAAAGLVAAGVGLAGGQDTRPPGGERPPPAGQHAADVLAGGAPQRREVWEYLFVGRPAAAELPGVLARHGRDGWELAAVLAMTREEVRAAAAADPKRVVAADGAADLLVLKRPAAGR